MTLTKDALPTTWGWAGLFILESNHLPENLLLPDLRKLIFAYLTIHCESFYHELVPISSTDTLHSFAIPPPFNFWEPFRIYHSYENGKMVTQLTHAANVSSQILEFSIPSNQMQFFMPCHFKVSNTEMLSQPYGNDEIYKIRCRDGVLCETKLCSLNGSPPLILYASSHYVVFHRRSHFFLFDLRTETYLKWPGYGSTPTKRVRWNSLNQSLEILCFRHFDHVVFRITPKNIFFD